MLSTEGMGDDTGGEAAGDDIKADDADDVTIQAEEETEPLAVPKAPVKPSPAEVEEHRITHFPFPAVVPGMRHGPWPWRAARPSPWT